MNYAKKGGVCLRHGAKIKLCSREGCTKQAKKEEFVSGTGETIFRKF
jgi:hypothetical protein